MCSGYVRAQIHVIDPLFPFMPVKEHTYQPVDFAILKCFSFM
uniref:Uncharacterized protein n=1 Tax=Anguilla anguilla TaxID=7936 RepID=A0A0E9QLV2_ANGAN